MSNVSSLLQNFHIPVKVVPNTLQTKKGPKTSFQVACFVEFFDKLFSFMIWHKLANNQIWPVYVILQNFITILCISEVIQ